MSGSNRLSGNKIGQFYNNGSWYLKYTLYKLSFINGNPIIFEKSSVVSSTVEELSEGVIVVESSVEDSSEVEVVASKIINIHALKKSFCYFTSFCD